MALPTLFQILNQSTSLFGLTAVPFDAAPTFADIDNDGDFDALIGNGTDLRYFQNTGSATAPAFAAPVINPFGLSGFVDDVNPVFVDIDGDGDQDLFVGHYGFGGLDYFQNTGTASAPSFAAPVTAPFGLSYGSLFHTAPAFADIDGDGDFDAFMGDGYGQIFFQQNTGTPTAPAFSAPSLLFSTSVYGYVTPTFADIDWDGDLDAYVGNAAGEIEYFENTGTPTAPVFAAPVASPFGFVDIGTEAQPTFIDVDGDGDLDVFVGDGAGNLHFFHNTASILGTNGNDLLVGTNHTDAMFGFGGNDTFEGLASPDFISGGPGSDFARYTTSPAGVNVDLLTGTAAGGHAQGDILVGIENLTGSTFNDSLRGGNGNNRLIGGTGNDLLFGRSGNDTLNGGAGVDQLFGRAGNDVLLGGGAADLLDGGLGTDTASYAGSTAPVVADLANPASNTGDAAGDTYFGIEGLTGSAFNDALHGNGGNNQLRGSGGNDTVRGEVGHDTLNGGAGNDSIDGGAGNDVASGSGGADTIYGVTGNDNLVGGAQGDELRAGRGQDTLVGGGNHDLLAGGDHADIMFGGSGNDSLQGQSGLDTLDGGTGNDVLVGGANADRFIFALGYGQDSINDFTDNQDKLHLDDALWGGGLTKQQVVNMFASVVGGHTVFDFGADELTVRFISNPNDLINDISIV